MSFRSPEGSCEGEQRYFQASPTSFVQVLVRILDVLVSSETSTRHRSFFSGWCTLVKAPSPRPTICIRPPAHPPKIGWDSSYLGLVCEGCSAGQRIVALGDETNVRVQEFVSTIYAPARVGSRLLHHHECRLKKRYPDKDFEQTESKHEPYEHVEELHRSSLCSLSLWAFSSKNFSMRRRGNQLENRRQETFSGKNRSTELLLFSTIIAQTIHSICGTHACDDLSHTHTPFLWLP